jgi:uncharacterized protein YndB with AHSA1/START domain
MSGRSVKHATFVVERNYEAPPERAFAAWADPEAKARWFVGSEAHLKLDFRVGGRERSQGTAPEGSVEFTPVGDNDTRLVFTEQGAFLDRHESPARRAEGMGSLLDALDKELQSAAPGA